MYIDNGKYFNRVDKWTSNTTSSVPVMYINDSCHGFFVDIYENLYCSLGDLHQVIQKLANGSINATRIIAGNGTKGSTSNMLNSPRGIFLNTKLDLYVADCKNNRIQLFPFGQLNGITVASNNSMGNIALNCPTAIVLDADEYLFIADSNNHRIIGSGYNGLQCLVGCSGVNGSASYQLASPRRISFDSGGNIFIIDRSNRRIQKFLLATNSCGK